MLSLLPTTRMHIQHFGDKPSEQFMGAMPDSLRQALQALEVGPLAAVSAQHRSSPLRLCEQNNPVSGSRAVCICHAIPLDYSRKRVVG